MYRHGLWSIHCTKTLNYEKDHILDYGSLISYEYHNVELYKD